MLRRIVILGAILAVGGGLAGAAIALHSHSGTAGLAAGRTTAANAGGLDPAHPMATAHLLLFTRAGGGLNLVGPNGGVVVPLAVRGAYGPDLGRGVWSPDGRRIALQANGPDGSHIEVANADGSGVQDVSPTAPHIRNLDPTWSPDGTRIAYSREPAGGNPAIWVLSLNGDHATHQLTDGSAHDVFPAWSPDGERIAFVRTIGSADHPHAAVMVMDADGAHARPLVGLTQAGVTVPPAWSPDATRVAFCDGTPTSMQIWTIRIDATKPTRLTSDSTGHFDPAWSPDGKHIAFARFTGSNPGIYVMNADGTGAHQITDATTGPLADARGRLDGQPEWRP